MARVKAAATALSALLDITAPADISRAWDGWGTALKPACELIVLARKPLSEGTVAANVLRWGTGAINMDGVCESRRSDYQAIQWPIEQQELTYGDNYDRAKANQHGNIRPLACQRGARRQR